MFDRFEMREDGIFITRKIEWNIGDHHDNIYLIPNELIYFKSFEYPSIRINK